MLDYPGDRVVSSFLEGCVLVETGTVSRMNHRQQERAGGRKSGVGDRGSSEIRPLQGLGGPSQGRDTVVCF